MYEATGTDTYVLVKEWQPNPANWVPGATVKSQIPSVDFDEDGVVEIYLSDTKGNSWIITPGGDVATMFDDANWSRLHDWKVGLVFGTDYNEGGEVRGNLIADVDGDGKRSIYLAGNNFGAILDIEWDGGTVDDLGTALTVTSITNDGLAGTGRARILMATGADADKFAAGDRIQLSGTADEEYEVFAAADPNVDLTTNVTTAANDAAKEFVYAADVTVGDDYSYYKTPIVDTDVQGGSFARPANIQIVDMDGDELMEILAIVPWSGDNPIANLLGLYVFEQDANKVGDNTALTNVWHEASDAVFKRGYVLTAGGSLRADVDIDKDGLGEFLAYEQDGGERIVYLFEATNATDNEWVEVWSFQFSDGEAGIVGGERGIMVMDIDEDGKEEIVIIVDSVDPADTANDGFNAGHIFEWDGTGTSQADNNGLPSTPTATFDPPRDAIDQVRLENNSLVWDVDGDGELELVLTHRGGNGMFLSIISLAPSTSGTLDDGVDVTVEFDETFVFVGVEDGPLAQVPSDYSLGQNYPNPFNPSTTIAYDVPAASNVSINIYDMLGRNVITLVNEQKNAGSHTVEWNGKNSSGIQVTSGIYFYRLEAGQSAITKKMLLLR
ncbi:MAG: T9SS type A sorting domain-containing protein [Candidatus Marinimicrobia bacterium]|nr:T9SS type A sorting domain-containing protein [Candidatus Neomarinimicrobiota bacterium]